MSKIRIGLIQMLAEKGAVEENLSKHISYLLEAEKIQIDILAFPEASLTGYINPAKYPDAVIDSQSATVKELITATSRLNVMILPGIIEQNFTGTGKPYVTQLVIQNGQLIGQCRKRTNIFDNDLEWFSSVEDATVFQSPKLKFGISICADLGNDSVFEGLSAKGVAAVFELAAPGLHGPQEGRNWQTGFEWWRGECHKWLSQHAKKHSIWTFGCTQSGRTIDEDFPGGAFIFSPAGRCLLDSVDGRVGSRYVEIDLQSETAVELTVD